MTSVVQKTFELIMNRQQADKACELPAEYLEAVRNLNRRLRQQFGCGTYTATTDFLIFTTEDSPRDNNMHTLKHSDDEVTSSFLTHGLVKGINTDIPSDTLINGLPPACYQIYVFEETEK